MAAKSGTLLATDYIWQNGLPRWFVVSEVVGLLPAGQGGMPSLTAALPPPPALRLPPARPNPIVEQAALVPQPPARSRDVSSPSGNDGPIMLMPQAERGTLVRRAADTIANQIVAHLDRNGIATLDDLATPERLRTVGEMVFDAIPASARFFLSRTFGRPFIEDRIVDVMIALRNSLPRDTRRSDLRDAILAHAPALAQRIDDALIAAKTKARAAMSTAWTSTLAGMASVRVATAASAPRLLPQSGGPGAADQYEIA